MQDKKLRKYLYGFWYSVNENGGGPNISINNKWVIESALGIIPHLLEEIDQLKQKIKNLAKK